MIAHFEPRRVQALLCRQSQVEIPLQHELKQLPGLPRNAWIRIKVNFQALIQDLFFDQGLLAASEQRLAHKQAVHDDPAAPEVRLVGEDFLEDFRGHVRSGASNGVLKCDFVPGLDSASEVDDLDDDVVRLLIGALLLEADQVVKFQIPVYDVQRVHVVNCLQKLGHDVPRRPLAELPVSAYEL